ncbi:MAG: DNA replication and repair protein RecF, partial [Bacteroidota bacterium]
QLTYKSQLQEKDIEALFEENREKDRILQRTTSGVHKDDLVFQIEDRPLKRFASQGQLKSYILALKLSQFEILRQYKEQIPILLLDDIFDKLDQHRVKQLLELLNQPNFGQVFITDTNPNRVARIIEKLDVEQQQFLVEHGKISELPLN